jgi:GTPase SAR1 family protein
MPFAQLVIGPPGAGKSTYCNGMHQFMSAIGRRCSIVNLDPANDKTSYPCALDIRDLVTLEEIMAEDTLGPNGGVLYALEELENNFDWLKEGLQELGGELFPAQRACIYWRSILILVSFRGLRSVRLPRTSRALYAPRFLAEYLLPDIEAWL